MNRLGQSLVAAVTFAPLILGVVVASASVVATNAPWQFAFGTLAFYAVGFSSFVWAKLSVEPEGPLFSLPPSKMTARNRALYGLGYALMLIGGFLTVLLYLVTFANGRAVSAV